MRKVVVAAAVAGAVCGMAAIAPQAHAALLLFGGGAVTTQPSSGTNELFNPLYGVNSVDGYTIGDPNNVTQLGIVLDVLGPQTLSFYYLGSEAGYKNTFVYDGLFGKTTPGGGTDIPGYPPSPVDPEFIGSVIVDGAAATFLPFAFIANGGNAGTGGVTNGGFAINCGDCSIFLTFLDASGDPTTNKAGRVLDMFFDDGETDDNHDDMGIRIVVTPVPVPAALPIIGAALAGFGFAGYRNRRNG